MANKPYSFPPSSPMDHLLIQTLINRFNHLSPSSDDHLPLSDEESTELPDLSDDNLHRRTILKEEAKLEKEITRIIRAGNAEKALKANSGQSITIGEHNICVGVHEEAGGNYKVWEWHGHIMMFDEEDGFNAEYVYGNYFERLLDGKGKKGEEEEEEEEVGEMRGGSSGLKDLIGDFKGLSGDGNGRVVHRNFVSGGSSAK